MATSISHKGQAASVASETDAGTLSNNANSTYSVTSGPKGNLQSVASETDAGTLSNNANASA